MNEAETKIVKQFIEMMEDNYDETKGDLDVCIKGECENPCRYINEGYTAAHKTIAGSHEYEALKAVREAELAELAEKDKIIQELHDKFEAYTERLESKELMSDIEDLAGKYLTKEEGGLQLKTFYKIAQAAINVIKGDLK